MPRPPSIVNEAFFTERSAPEPNTGCWLWTLRRDRDGYGTTKVCQKHLRGHRLAYEFFIRPVPDGMQVCHTCDTPACVNPVHLWLGTTQENTADRDQKGRTARGDRQGLRKNPESRPMGERNGSCKIPDSEVPEILRRRAAGESQQRIADDYGVSQVQISRIERGVSRRAA